MKKFYQNANGFSFHELLISTVLMGAVAFFFVSGSKYLNKSQKKLEERSLKSLSEMSFDNIIWNIMVKVAPSIDYLHLPIPVKSCQTNTPCVKRKNAQGEFIDENNFPVDGMDFVEFYSDANANLSTPTFLRNKNLSAPLYGPKRFIWPSAEQSLYVTWPLEDASSAPFPLLINSDLNTTFYFDQVLSSSSGGDEILLKREGEDRTEDELRGRIIVLASSFDPRQYFIKWVEEVKKCSEAARRCACLNLGASLNSATYTACAEGETTSTDTSLDQYFALTLKPLTDSSIEDQIEKHIPSLSYVNSDLRWNQQTSPYAFPTEVYSLQEVGHIDFLPANSMKLPRIGHFYNGFGGWNPNIFGFFVEIGSFKIVEVSSGGSTIKNLMFQKFVSQTKSTEYLVKKDMPGPVLITRQLGTNIINFVFEE